MNRPKRTHLGSCVMESAKFNGKTEALSIYFVILPRNCEVQPKGMGWRKVKAIWNDEQRPILKKKN